jgi:hypothetical protein
VRYEPQLAFGRFARGRSLCCSQRVGFAEASWQQRQRPAATAHWWGYLRVKNRFCASYGRDPELNRAIIPGYENRPSHLSTLVHRCRGIPGADRRSAAGRAISVPFCHLQGPGAARRWRVRARRPGGADVCGRISGAAERLCLVQPVDQGRPDRRAAPERRHPRGSDFLTR